MLNILREQPRAFHMIFMLELWERFGFYTVQGILTLFFIRYLGYNDTISYYTFGAYSALVYGMVVIGGYLGDRILGTKRTIILGLVVLAAGYFSLAITNKENVFFALGLICVGNGLFKANPSNLLAKCYQENDPRLHGGFTLYYMAINLGSMIALFAGPAISSRYGYSYAYMMSAIGLLMGLANYWLQHQYVAHINTDADKRTISFFQWILIFVGIFLLTECSAYLLQHVMLAKNLFWFITLAVIVYYLLMTRKESKIIRMRMLVALVLMLEAIIFFTLYQQMPTSLNLFAVNNVIPVFFGITIDAQSFQALNPIWIVLMSPVLAYFYDFLNKKGIQFSIPFKFSLGMTMCGLSFLMLFFARYFYVDHGMVSSWWLIISYLFQSLGELLVSALGVAMVAELVPAQIAGFVMGMWFLTSAIAGFIGATVASYTALPEHIKPGVESLMIYTHVFAVIGIVTLIIAFCMWLLSPRLSRYIAVKKTDLHQEAREAEYSVSRCFMSQSSL
ncbi:oligopeptide:H+ symporter [Fluoribacter dumoffii]|uniref:Dipeptide and tripeptide permease B n=1 Tax=Fluoribacter dumoffii TaxID=463 RepID=A0A377G5Z1_9GAMM|nr:oligopeptide:H+ symporter [Fluoribacter dumoffii]KTC91694.1 transporter [Fluoribacter dumoffii NY 23]MCW8387180.1 oligopeptide:H+ symporter [Fluoribacter dumoffii]MCW8497384.1 oligopeptide:H+ symporter [Fluoribacter dumoffii]STO20163.1 Dipeptide and tripeptide permease B [Fluoribacter dumoffii]